jgi:hypothetical protein
MTATFDALQASPPTPPSADAFGHSLAQPGDPLAGAAFDALFDAKIKPELLKREAERKAAIGTFFVVLAGGVVAVMLENYLTPPLTNFKQHYAPWWLDLITIFAAGIFGRLPLAGVARRAKASVLAALCAPLGVAFSASGKQPAWFDAFLSLKLLPHSNSRIFTDFFHGRRGAADFDLCEAKLVVSGGQYSKVAFKGQLLRLTMPHPFVGCTVVLRNAGWLQHFQCPKGLSAIAIDDPQFNHIFAVFGSDEIAARQTLTPALMHQLLALEAAFAGAHLRCAFDESQLLIALEGPNRFELGGMFSNLAKRSRVEGVARNLEQVFKLIDQFGGA